MGFKDRKEPEPKTGENVPKTGKRERFTTASERIKQSDSGYVPTYEAVTEPPARLVLASGGLPKRGKTTFGFTMPKPLAYLQLDANYEHALAAARKKYGKKQEIRHIRYEADPRGDVKAANAALFDRIIKDFIYCIHNFHSVLVDTYSEVLDVRKRAEFGRTAQIPQMYYGGFYADLSWLVKEALKTNCNVCFSHRLKKEYRNDQWDGDYEMEGWRGVLFDTQVYIRHDRNEANVFETTIVECAQNAMLMGQTLSSEPKEADNDFPHLASQIFGNDVEDWQ